MESNKINIDYIGVVTLNNAGRLEYKQVPIEKPFHDKMEEIKAMLENDNRTLMDLQDYFLRFVPQEASAQGYDYVAPYTYNSSFIESAFYPKIYTFTEYKQVLKEAENIATEKFLSKLDLKDVRSLTPTQQKDLLEFTESEIDAAKELLKKTFCRTVLRYMNAFWYYQTLKLVKANSQNKMFSTENLGWTTFNYPISEDILFFMKSNFGYGSSSYHFINLSYKGIDILPYSALVKYRYVRIAEFFRYTRQYRPNRENWEVALDFVTETANLALKDATVFVSKWIANEIEEMIQGLEIISKEPQKALQDMIDHPEKDINFFYVRNADSSDKSDLKAFPSEISTIFKAEKLSAALELLEKLKNLEDAYPKVIEAIDRIKKLNVDFFPNLKENISAIEMEIKRRETLLKPKIAERDALKNKGKVHYDKIEELKDKARKKNIFNFTTLYKDYFVANPDFKKLYDEVNEKTEVIQKEEEQISIRENFVERLTDCMDIMVTHLGLAA